MAAAVVLFSPMAAETFLELIQSTLGKAFIFIRQFIFDLPVKIRILPNYTKKSGTQ